MYQGMKDFITHDIEKEIGQALQNFLSCKGMKYSNR
jgi:hypothetical protein